MSVPPLRFFLDPEVAQRGVAFNAPREGDAGFDLRAADALAVPAGGQAVVPTGLRIAVPLGFVAIVKDRSSMALKRVYTHAGVIDAGYRGEVKIVLSNGGDAPYQIAIGDKIAQLVIVPCLTGCEAVSTLENLGATDRGAGGFGSTGRA